MNPAAYFEMAETEGRHWWFAGRRDIVANEISKLALPSEARILEVGCGTGGNLDMLSRFGAVSALEMNDVARELAHSKSGGRFDIRAGCCPLHIPAYGHKFDLICLLDVLEHVEDDVGTLAALKGLLSDNGRILITVPAYQWLWGPHDEFLHHKRRYSSTDLREKLDSAGLIPRKISYFNTVLFPLAVLVRMKDLLLKKNGNSGGEVPPWPLNPLLRSIFGAERFLLNGMRLPFGLSLIAIMTAKRP